MGLSLVHYLFFSSFIHMNSPPCLSLFVKLGEYQTAASPGLPTLWLSSSHSSLNSPFSPKSDYQPYWFCLQKITFTAWLLCFLWLGHQSLWLFLPVGFLIVPHWAVLATFVLGDSRLPLAPYPKMAQVLSVADFGSTVSLLPLFSN